MGAHPELLPRFAVLRINSVRHQKEAHARRKTQF